MIYELCSAQMYHLLIMLSITLKCRMLEFLKKSIKNKHNKKVLITLYNTMIRSFFEYCSIIWNLYPLIHIQWTLKFPYIYFLKQGFFMQFYESWRWTKSLGCSFSFQNCQWTLNTKYSRKISPLELLSGSQSKLLTDGINCGLDGVVEKIVCIYNKYYTNLNILRLLLNNLKDILR